jgi:hypothetical protein
MKNSTSPFAVLFLLVTASTICLVTTEARASFFEVECYSSPDEVKPEFTILTEDRVNFTFAAYTQNPTGQEGEQRVVMSSEDEGDIKTMTPKREGKTLATRMFSAARLQIRSEFFSERFEPYLRNGVVDAARLLQTDGSVTAAFICYRVQ